MRKIAIDLTYQPVGGALSQIKELIANVDIYKFDRVVFYTTKDNLHLFEANKSAKIELKTVNFSNKSIFIRTLWSQIILPVSLIINNINVLFCTGNISPIFCSKKKSQWIGTVGPFVAGFIDSFPWRQKIVLFVSKCLMIVSARTSDLVFFESRYTQELFSSRYGQKESNSATLYIGKDDYFHPVKKTNKINKFDYNNAKFILTVSHLYPYKNIETLIESFCELELHKKGLYLFVAGSIVDNTYYEKLQSMVKEFNAENSIVFLGRVEKQSLRELYSLCHFFVFTSPYENFAYTLVEAMSCGAPIIATNTTAMPETCGSAALYFQPESKEQLSKHMLTFLNDKSIRDEFKDKSIRKIKSYDNYTLVNQKTGDLLQALTMKK